MEGRVVGYQVIVQYRGKNLWVEVEGVVSIVSGQHVGEVWLKLGGVGLLSTRQ